VPKQFQKNQMKKINKPNYKLKSISISSPNSLFDPTDKQESQESTFQQM
jgi:hypothetical protein